MPFTIFHWGLPLVLLEFLPVERVKKYRMQLCMLILVTIPDIEGFLALVLKIREIPVHGILHSVLGTIGIGILFNLIVLQIRSLDITMPDILRFNGSDFSFRVELIVYLLTPLIFHLGLDVFMHHDIILWYPLADGQNQFATIRRARIVTNIGAISLFIVFLKKLIEFILLQIKQLQVNGNITQ